MLDENVQLLTQQGFDDLKAELLSLKDIKIPETAKRIDEAKQQGDLSENAEYDQARKEMDDFQARSAMIRYILDNAKIMSSKTNSSVVDVGSTVVFLDQKGNDKKYIIVGPQEADPMSGKISNESPIGKSFLGSKVGDKVKVQTPAGVNEYKIIEIS